MVRRSELFVNKDLYTLKIYKNVENRNVINDRLKSKLENMSDDQTMQVIAAYVKKDGSAQAITKYFSKGNVPILSHMKTLRMVCVDLTPHQIYNLAKQDYIKIISENRKLDITLPSI